MIKNENTALAEVSDETLDPANKREIKKLGQKMLDDMFDFVQNTSKRPVWKKPPEEVKTHFDQSIPEEAQSLSDVYTEFKQNILPYHLGNIHPRFWGWVMGNGSAQGMMAEMLTAAMNSNAGIGDQSPMYVDRQVINWCKQMMDFPENSSGTLVNGASAANLNALIVARNSVNDRIRKEGLQVPGKRLVMYASTETHSSIQKAAEIIGIGSDGIRKVRVDKNYRMDVRHLNELLKEDKEAGHIPFCVVANVGTVNTAAIDPLEEIFLTCMRYNTWFHIDGAFGALVKLLPEYQKQLACISLADSIAFDLHKWMHIPYDAGVVLVKDASKHRRSFALQPDYISHHERGIAAGPELASNFGFDLSRGFKALKVWMTLKEHGLDKFRRLIRQNLRQAKYLEHLIQQQDNLELMAPVSMNIVCFRYKPGKITDEQLNELNKEILMRLQEEGIAAPSGTRLNGNECIRAAIVNHRSKQKDFDILVREVLRIGKAIAKQEGTNYLEMFNSLV